MSRTVSRIGVLSRGFVGDMKRTIRIKVRLAKRIIQRQDNGPISLEAIAEQLDISYNTLRRYFQQIEGTTLGAYCNERRVEIAKGLLQHSELLVYQVACVVGFSTSSNFIRWFKKNVGVSPNDFKNGAEEGI